MWKLLHFPQVGGSDDLCYGGQWSDDLAHRYKGRLLGLCHRPSTAHHLPSRPTVSFVVRQPSIVRGLTKMQNLSAPGELSTAPMSVLFWEQFDVVL